MLVNKYKLKILVLISLVLIVSGLFIYYTINSKKNKDIKTESFIATMKDYILKGECPDYITKVDNKYYVYWNSKPTEPLEFSNINELTAYFNSNADVADVCPLMKPIDLKPNKASTDVSIDHERKCNNSTAMNRYLVDLYNFQISDDDKTKKNLNKKLGSIEFVKEDNPEFNKKYNADLAKFINNINKRVPGIADDLPNLDTATKEEIKRILEDYLFLAEPDDLIDYDVKQCMVNEIANDLELGNFNTVNNSLFIIDGKVQETELDNNGIRINDANEIDVDEILNINTNVKYPLLDMDYDLNRQPITKRMADKIFSV